MNTIAKYTAANKPVDGHEPSSFPMKFFYRDLGYLQGGEIVEFTLKGSAANVRLLDSSSFSSYKAGRRHRYVGGHATKSPVRLQVPRAGHWYAVLDFGGYSGSARWNARVLPGRLPPLREQSLRSVASLVRDVESDDSQTEPSYDVFISYASEDRDDVVRPLAQALRESGLNVWFDEFELKIGHSLRRKIDRGISSSRFGIVVLSQSFFEKGWTNYELDGLVTRSIGEEQILLPLWHNVSKQQVQSYSASLADTVARSTANYTLEEIAAEIFDVIRGEERG